MKENTTEQSEETFPVIFNWRSYQSGERAKQLTADAETHAHSLFFRKNCRKDSFMNSDKCGRQEQGKSKCRQTSAVLCTPTQSNQCCNFSVNVCLDEHGYYLDEKTGNPNHRFHCLPLSKNTSMPV